MLIAGILIVALLAGLAAKMAGLPALVGYLVAGFALNFSPEFNQLDLNTFADTGITLLLFTIGLKLDLKTLARPFVFGVSTLHMISVCLLGTV